MLPCTVADITIWLYTHINQWTHCQSKLKAIPLEDKPLLRKPTRQTRQSDDHPAHRVHGSDLLNSMSEQKLFQSHKKIMKHTTLTSQRLELIND